MIHFYHCCFSFFPFKKRLNRVSIRKNVAQFLRKKAKIMSFVALHFCAIISKLHFAQNWAISLFRYCVLRTLYLYLWNCTFWHKIATLKELITYLKLFFVTWCMMAHCKSRRARFTQKSRRILPTTPFKRKLKTDT